MIEPRQTAALIKQEISDPKDLYKGKTEEKRWNELMGRFKDWEYNRFGIPVLKFRKLNRYNGASDSDLALLGKGIASFFDKIELVKDDGASKRHYAKPRMRNSNIIDVGFGNMAFLNIQQQKNKIIFELSEGLERKIESAYNPEIVNRFDSKNVYTDYLRCFTYFIAKDK